MTTTVSIHFPSKSIGGAVRKEDEDVSHYTYLCGSGDANCCHHYCRNLFGGQCLCILLLLLLLVFPLALCYRLREHAAAAAAACRPASSRARGSTCPDVLVLRTSEPINLALLITARRRRRPAHECKRHIFAKLQPTTKPTGRPCGPASRPGTAQLAGCRSPCGHVTPRQSTML